VLVPLYGFLRGDVLGLVVLVHDDEPVSKIAERIAEAAACRLPPVPLDVYFQGKKLDPALTIAAAGLTALDRIDAIPAGSSVPEGA
jgi:hypothetical protein